MARRRERKGNRVTLTGLQSPFIGYRRAPRREQWHWWAWVAAWGLLGLAVAVWL